MFGLQRQSFGVTLRQGVLVQPRVSIIQREHAPSKVASDLDHCGEGSGVAGGASGCCRMVSDVTSTPASCLQCKRDADRLAHAFIDTPMFLEYNRLAHRAYSPWPELYAAMLESLPCSSQSDGVQLHGLVLLTSEACTRSLRGNMEAHRGKIRPQLHLRNQL
jgi:hypothetical protein